MEHSIKEQPGLGARGPTKQERPLPFLGVETERERGMLVKLISVAGWRELALSCQAKVKVRNLGLPRLVKGEVVEESLVTGLNHIE